MIGERSNNRSVEFESHAAQRTARRPAVAILIFALLLVGVVYRSTYLSLLEKWISDAAYSHGFLIVPISAWLAWRKRSELAGVEFTPSVWGAVATLASTMAWLVARGSGILVIEQIAAVALIPSLVLAALGWAAFRVLLAPLAFLLLAVPFGRSLVPALMQSTADFSTLLLRWSGVPVFRSHMHISIPGGNFEVARACSGLNYFITSFVLGVLYAYLNFRAWRKRLLCVAAFVVIPIILNALRVYITILVSHWTNMRFGPGYEHVTFGRIFFIASMLLLFWIGRRWHDEGTGTPRIHPSDILTRPVAWTGWWPLLLACGLAMAGPALLESSIARSRAAVADTSALIRFPPGSESWRGPDAVEAHAWRPLYHGGIAERQVRYANADAASVDAFVAVYGLGNTLGHEMVSYSNVVSGDERTSLAPEIRRRVEITADHVIDVRELQTNDGQGARLVWYWFVVGKRPVTGNMSAKMLEALMFMTGRTDLERIVVLSTPGDQQARATLEAFMKSHGSCVVLGFTGEDCGT
jgi:exosortase A